MPENANKNGIKNYTPLPGRFSTIGDQPLIIADGAHNPDKIAYLIKKLKDLYISRFKKRTLIFAAAENKNWKQMLKPLFPFFDKIYLTRHTVLQRRSADLKKLYNFSRLRHKDIQIFIDPNDALREARTQSGKNDFILATGSLFLAGSVMKEYQNKK
jgi:dihydrofolate synthase/folylpolyglutamate synthase